MNESCGLLVVDLQYGFAPDPEVIEKVRDTAADYPVVVATRFAPDPGNPLLQRQGPSKEGGGGD